MRKSTSIVVTLATMTLSTSAFGQLATRKDYNGEMVNAAVQNGGQLLTAGAPYGWNQFGQGTGGGLVGGACGPSNACDQWVLRNEYEDGLPNPPGTAAYSYPGGHMTLVGGSGGASGAWGLSQNIVATAGKHYWMYGAFRQVGTISTSGFTAGRYGIRYGLSETGAGSGGQVYEFAGGNLNQVTKMGGTSFNSGMVSSGATLTAQFGRFNSATTSDGGMHHYVDGVRVWERDVPVYSSLQNGNMEGVVQSASDWNLNNTADFNGNSANGFKQGEMLDGWLPMGGSIGKITEVGLGLNGVNGPAANGSAQSIFVDQYQAFGRQYFMQHVKLGGAGTVYDLAGQAWAFTPTGTAINGATPQIGIDPTGGNDPTSASIIWSTAAAADNTWKNLAVNGVVGGANGVTVWLAGGYNGQNGAAPFRASGTTGFAFDNIVLTPEPATVAFLAIGGLMMIRRRKTA